MKRTVWCNSRAPLKHWSVVVVPGAAALSEGEIPRVHLRARSRQRLRPVGRPDPGEERVAFHPWPKEDGHHCRGLCAALTALLKRLLTGNYFLQRIQLLDNQSLVSEPVVTLTALELFETAVIQFVHPGNFVAEQFFAKTVINWLGLYLLLSNVSMLNISSGSPGTVCLVLCLI